MQFLVDLRFAQNFFPRWKKRVKLAFFCSSFARIPRDKQQKAFSSVTWKNVVARATKFSSLACARARCGSVSLQNEPDYVRAFFPSSVTGREERVELSCCWPFSATKFPSWLSHRLDTEKSSPFSPPRRPHRPSRLQQICIRAFTSATLPELPYR
jgi:hypothetical protein